MDDIPLSYRYNKVDKSLAGRVCKCATVILWALLIGAVYVSLFGRAEAQEAQPQLFIGDCFTEFEELHDLLEHEFGESIVAAGGSWAMWENPTTGTWTITEYTPDGVCITEWGAPFINSGGA